MAAARRVFADPAADAARLLVRLALFLLMVATPVAELIYRGPLYVFLPVGACILIVAGRLASARAREDRAPRLLKILSSPIAGAAMFLFFWAGLSLLWTPFPDEAATRFFKAAATALLVFFAILALPAKTEAENLYFLPIGLAITAVATIALTLFAPQIFWQGEHPDSTLAQRSVMTLTVLLWPALGALGLRERWLLAVVLAAVATAAALATFIQVALVALALSAVVYAIAVSDPQRVGQILGFGLAGLALLAPVAALVTLAITNLAHVPHVGPGLVFADLFLREWPRFITGHGVDFAQRALEIGVLPRGAPHSILFKFWYELGILGVLAFAVLAVGAFIAAGRTPIYIAPALLAGLVSGLVVTIWGAETTQIWWISLAGLDAIALALFCKGLPLAKRPLAPLAETEPFEADSSADFGD
ncbi:MAG: hypothetical protein AB1508_01295 [Pseudomonadota bacterium]